MPQTASLKKKKKKMNNHSVCPSFNWPITKTSGNLGQNQQRKGTWDRLEGQDKQKCLTSTIVAVRAARYSAIVLPRHLFWLDWLNPAPPNDPKRHCGIDSDSASRSFWQWPRPQVGEDPGEGGGGGGSLPYISYIGTFRQSGYHFQGPLS